MTRDIHLGGSASTGKQTNDVMLSTEVARYRKLKRQEYQQLYEGGDLEALLFALDDQQRLLFAGDCLQHLMANLKEVAHPLYMPAITLMLTYVAFVHGEVDRLELEKASVSYSRSEAGHISTVVPIELVDDYQIYWTLSNVVEWTLKGQTEWAAYWASANQPYHDYHLERALHYLVEQDLSND